MSMFLFVFSYLAKYEVSVRCRIITSQLFITDFVGRRRIMVQVL